MKKVLLILGICIIWSNTLCAQIMMSPRTEKNDFASLLHKKRDSSFLNQKRDSIRLARFEHRRNVESYLKSRDSIMEFVHYQMRDSIGFAKRDSARLAKFDHQRHVALNLVPRKAKIATVKIDSASYAKRLRSSGITSKIVNETTAGTLSSYFTDEEKSSISSLTITGKMDARDFKFLRDYFKGSSKN